jgi:hypothetical protein
MNKTSVSDVSPVSVLHMPHWVGIVRYAYTVIAVLLVSGLAAQVFLAGAGVLVNPGYFAQHRTLAHLLEGLPILMLLAGLFGRLPRRFSMLSLLLFLLFTLQYVFLYVPSGLGLPILRGLHAVNALALFSIAWSLARSGVRVLRAPLDDAR